MPISHWKAREILRHHPDCKVAILSMYDDEKSVVGAIRSGAHAFILKRASGTDLLDALRVVANVGAYLSPQVADRLLRRIQKGDLESKEQASALPSATKRSTCSSRGESALRQPCGQLHGVGFGPQYAISHSAKNGLSLAMTSLGLVFCRVRGFWKQTLGQDLIEYALMAGFVAVAAGAIMPGVSISISRIFSSVASGISRAASQGS